MLRTLGKERYELRMPDGEIHRLENGASAYVLSIEGEGIPPIEYVTQRGVYQHGETVRDYFLRPRTVQIVARKNFCDRITYWAGRTGLIDGVRPNRSLTPAPTVLRKYLPDGAKRDLDVRIAEGPAFAARDIGRWDEWSYQEVLRFIAHDPTWYDPTLQGAVLTSAQEQLVFPATFPIVFDSFQQTAIITYVGNWLTLPTIIINGPIENPVIRNETTDEQIELSTTIQAGESAVIDLRYGVKTITHSSGANLMGYLSGTSDLGTFHLTPANGGSNVIRVYGSESTNATNFTLQWYNRYIGI